MVVAALCLWIATALAGATLLGAWLLSGQVRREFTARGRHRRLPPQLVFSHLGLAVVGLGAWAGYLVTGQPGLAWVTLGLLAMVAAVGVTMFVRWVPSYRAARYLEGPGAAHRAPHRQVQGLPVAVVAGHGVLAVATVTLVVYVVIAAANG
jgi:hypothetical protein